MEKEINVKIEGPALMELLRPLDRFVRDLLNQVPDFIGNDTLIDNLALVFNEAYTNVNKHAYPDERKGPFWIRILIAPDHLEFRFEDLGESFDPLEVQDPDFNNPDEGGYGVWLIRQIMDEFIYYTEPPEGRNVLRLIKRFREISSS